MKKRAKKIVDTFNEATKDNDVLKNIAISTLYTANFESINKMIKLRSQDDPLSEQDIVDIIVNAGLSERQLGTTKKFGLVKDKYHGYTFEGNETTKILKNTRSLKRMIKRNEKTNSVLKNVNIYNINIFIFTCICY